MALPDRVAGAVARTPLVFGTAPLATGFWGNDEATAVAAAVEGIDRGIAWFDTAPLYGAGESERRLGAALAARAGADVVVSTKVGRPVVIGDGGAEAGFDYSASGTRRSLEDSLTRLGRDHVDIVHVHDPDDHLDVGPRRVLPRPRRPARRGDDRGGVGRHDGVRDGPAGARRSRARPGDDRQPADAPRPQRARRAGSGVRRGGRPTRGGRAVQQRVARPPGAGLVVRLRPRRRGVAAPGPGDGARCDDAGVSLRAAALQYPLRHDPVVAVVAGMASAAEVAENVELVAAPIPADLWTALEAI